MSVLFDLLSRYILWIYALCGAVILLSFRSLWLAVREQGRATFALEREQASERVLRSFLTMFSMLAVIGVAFLLDRYVAPLLPTPEELAVRNRAAGDVAVVIPTRTPTPRPLPVVSERQTPTVTPSPTPLDAPTPTPLPTETPTPGPPTPTPTPDSSLAFPPRSCPHPGAQITSPTNGSRLRGTVQVLGTADIGESFQFFKVEFGNGFAPEHWSVIDELKRQPVVGDVLVSWSAGILPAGAYTLKLRVVDKTGNWVDDCRVHVEVVK